MIAGGVVALATQAVLVTAPLVVKQIEARRFDELLRANGVGAESGRSMAQAGSARAWCRASGSVGWLEIPRLRVSAPVREGTGALQLLTAVGHVEGTAFPGESGNAVLAAHRDGWFGALADVAVGDSVLVSTPDGRFLYRVSQTLVVTPDRVDVMAPAGAEHLTLITCYPFSWVGPAPQRFVVRAGLIRRGTWRH